MNRRDFDIDHIDPRWEEGRDYQFVCGLDSSTNFRESDPSFNVSKSNRFLPWRWCRDEIGVVPENPGDLAHFLVGADIENDIPGEWVLMEFLSEEWFEATKDTHGAAARNNFRHLEEFHKANPEEKFKTLEKGRSKHLLWRSQNPGYEHAHAQMMRDRRIQKEKENPELFKERMRKVHEHHKYRWKCLVTGHISNAEGLTRYQNNRGIPPTPENRIRIN